MKPKYFITSFLCLCISLYSCKEQMSASDREAARQGTQSQEIKKIDDAQIIAAGLETGRSIANISQQTLGKTLKSQIQKEGIESAIKYCNLKAYPLVDSLSEKHSAQIRRVSLKLRNTENEPDSIERVLLDAYQYSIDEGTQLEDNIQDIGTDYLLYTKPILIGDPVCLQCHGMEGTDIAEETVKLLNSLYPDDMAREYSITEFRGMWSIRLSRKDIINSL